MGRKWSGEDEKEEGGKGEEKKDKREREWIERGGRWVDWRTCV